MASKTRQRAEDPGGICEFLTYGTHIALRCRNHPKLRWSTKNIGIGQRSIFYNLHDDPDMGPECACPVSDLYHDHKDDCKHYNFTRQNNPTNENLHGRLHCTECGHTWSDEVTKTMMKERSAHK